MAKYIHNNIIQYWHSFVIVTSASQDNQTEHFIFCLFQCFTWFFFVIFLFLLILKFIYNNTILTAEAVYFIHTLDRNSPLQHRAQPTQIGYMLEYCDSNIVLSVTIQNNKTERLILIFLGFLSFVFFFGIFVGFFPYLLLLLTIFTRK